MAKDFKRSYKFALMTSAYLTAALSLFTAAILYIGDNLTLPGILFYAVCCYGFSFFLIQFRLEHFIYRKIKSIYDNVRLLDATSVKPGQVTTDMATLSEEVEKFAEGKLLEIETLKVRENYRKEFMGNMAHELKTPLFTVQGYILTLLDGAIKDKTVRKKYLKRAEKGVERLIYIVKDLDMINKLETGDLHLKMERFDVVEVVQGVFDLLEMKASKNDISLLFSTKHDPVWVYGDQERIQQVITNLLVNSIKYGKKGGKTKVKIEDFGNNRIIIRIRDNGEGIEEANIPRLFERFFRVDKSGSRKEGGSGLGLSIVKHILEAHKQKIFVESKIGKGSEFSFTLKKSKHLGKRAARGGAGKAAGGGNFFQLF